MGCRSTKHLNSVSDDVVVGQVEYNDNVAVKGTCTVLLYKFCSYSIIIFGGAFPGSE